MNTSKSKQPSASNQPNQPEDLISDILGDETVKETKAEAKAKAEAEAKAKAEAEAEAKAKAADKGPKILTHGGQKFEVPTDWLSQVIVHQCRLEMVNGAPVEVPNTHELQTYAPEIFDRLNTEGKNGEPSFFSESKIRAIVLHDPRA